MSTGTQIFIFELDGKQYAFPVNYVKEVVAMPEYTPVPASQIFRPSGECSREDPPPPTEVEDINFPPQQFLAPEMSHPHPDQKNCENPHPQNRPP